MLAPVLEPLGEPEGDKRGVAQPGQRACFGYRRSWVRIPPPRPVFSKGSGEPERYRKAVSL
jgi:hypothetical protein